MRLPASPSTPPPPAACAPSYAAVHAVGRPRAGPREEGSVLCEPPHAGPRQRGRQHWPQGGRARAPPGPPPHHPDGTSHTTTRVRRPRRGPGVWAGGAEGESHPRVASRPHPPGPPPPSPGGDHGREGRGAWPPHPAAAPRLRGEEPGEVSGFAERSGGGPCGPGPLRTALSGPRPTAANKVLSLARRRGWGERAGQGWDRKTIRHKRTM